MNTVEDLRRTLERHATAAPDGADLVQRAQAGAARVRHGRIVQGVLAAAVVTAVAVGVPVAARMLPGHYAAPAAPTSQRAPLQLTVGLKTGSPFMITRHGADATRQFLKVSNVLDVRSRNPGVPGRNQGAFIHAYDPGAFDATEIRRGERVSVSGHDAWYVPDYSSESGGRALSGQEAGMSAVGWQEPSAGWIVVWTFKKATSRAELIEVAQSIRVHPAVEARVPFHLGWVPDALPATFVSLEDDPSLSLNARVAFGTAGTPAPDPVRFEPPEGAAIAILAMSSEDPDWPGIVRDLPAPELVGGHNTWYVPAPGKPFSDRPPQGSTMIVDAGSCRLWISVADRAAVSLDDLRRMVSNATFGRCDKLDGWTPPVG